jgi:tRNA(Ile2) C34 agmatinyltransferase TiaS
MLGTLLIWRETPVERAERLAHLTEAAQASTPHCPRCGYNMTGLTQARCPECGSQYTLDALIAANLGAAHQQLELGGLAPRRR